MGTLYKFVYPGSILWCNSTGIDPNPPTNPDNPSGSLVYMSGILHDRFDPVYNGMFVLIPVLHPNKGIQNHNILEVEGHGLDGADYWVSSGVGMVSG